MTDAPLFKGEAMLLSWGDTSSRGKTVTFALHPDECGDAHPFRGLGTGKTGQRFAIVAVPITDDEETSPEALDQVTPQTVATGSTPAEPKQPVASGETKGGWYALKPSARAALLCKEVQFQHWAAKFYGLSAPLLTSDEAADWLRDKIGVMSRADLDAQHEDPEHPAKVRLALLRFAERERAYRIARGLETEAR